MPEISIILKVDDGNRYLQEAVNNVFMQSFSDFELLVLKEGANYEDRYAFENFECCII